MISEKQKYIYGNESEIASIMQGKYDVTHKAAKFDVTVTLRGVDNISRELKNFYNDAAYYGIDMALFGKDITAITMYNNGGE